MPSIKYTKSVVNDFPNDKVDAGRLTEEIKDSANITKALDFISVSGDVCDIWFKEALSVEEESSLTSICLAHSGSPLEEIEDPRTSDGKRIFLPNLFTGDVNANYTGSGDDIDNGSRFGGQIFQANSTVPEQLVTEFQFMEWVYIAGGAVWYADAVLGDWIAYEVYAPPTVGMSTPDAGLFTKYPVAPGANMYIPQQDGGWTLDLDEKFNDKVGFTKVVPVPATNMDGFFDWNPDTEVITINPTQRGEFNLFDFPITLGRFVNKVPMLRDGSFPLTVPAIKPKKLLAHWKHKVIVNNSTAKQLQAAWMLFLARRSITPPVGA